MVIAAFVISVLAIVVSGLSVVYVRSQALSAKGLAGIERARHHDERTPRFEAEIEAVSGGWFRLWLRLTSSEALTSLEVDADESSGITFTSGQQGVDPSGSSPLRATAMTGLVPDAREAWRISLPAKRPEQMRLLVRAQAGDDRWDVPVLVAVPYGVTYSVH
jgi:hypothetical protein